MQGEHSLYFSFNYPNKFPRIQKCIQATYSNKMCMLVYNSLLFLLPYRFGLSNKFESEFPSALTGKVSVLLVLIIYILACLLYDYYIGSYIIL